MKNFESKLVIMFWLCRETEIGYNYFESKPFVFATEDHPFQALFPAGCVVYYKNSINFNKSFWKIPIQRQQSTFIICKCK